MKKVLVNLAAITGISLLAMSCAQVGNVKAVDAGTLSSLKKGVTTKKEVHSFLGQPHDVRPQTSGSRWTYYRVTSKMNGLGLIPFAGLFLPGMNTTSSISHIYFDPGYRFSKSDINSSWDMQNPVAQLGRSADSFKNDQQNIRVREEMTKLGLPFDEKEANMVKDAGTILGANSES